MQEDDYRDLMDLFYFRMAGFLRERPETYDELEALDKYVKELNVEDETRRMLIFDYYIFDYKSEILSKNPLVSFLSKADLDNETRSLYEGFKNSVFSIFEVKALRIGKEMITLDLATGKEYTVKDTTLTKKITKGQCGFARVLPYKDYYIFTGKAYFYPSKASYYLKLHLLDIRTQKKPFKLSPVEMCKAFYAQEKPEKLPTLERFRLICREGRLEDDEIDTFISKVKENARNKGDFTILSKEILSKMNPNTVVNYDEIRKTFLEMWNKFIPESGDCVKPGPVEQALISSSMSYVQLKVKPKRYKNEDKASNKANNLFEKWIKTPRQELNGKTPEETIREEREKLGNPARPIRYKINISSIMLGEEVIKKAETIYNRARELLTNNKPTEAIAAYKEYLALNSENHVVWLNMGVAHMRLNDKINAMKYFKKALELKPDYEIAKNNIALLSKTTKKDK